MEGTKMKKILYIIMMLATATVMSARPSQGKSFYFAYIAHDESTYMDDVMANIQARYDRAMEDENYVMVVYMSNGDSPFIVQVNTAKDNRADFAKLKDVLRTRSSHAVYPEEDLEKIVDLFNEVDFVNDQDNSISYRSADWHFHLTSGFLRNGYGESLISKLAFVMGVEHFSTENFRIRYYFSSYDILEYDHEYPFGRRNYSNLEFTPHYY